MSKRGKRGLHDSLSDIIRRQNAPRDDKSKLSSDLLSNFKTTESKRGEEAKRAERSQVEKKKHQSTPSATPSATPSIRPSATPSIEPQLLDATHTSSEQKVYSVMYRETISKGINSRNFSVPELARMTGIGGQNTIRRALRGLIAKLSIKMTGEDLTGRYGPRYRVSAPKEIQEARRRAGIRIEPKSKRILTPSTTPSTTPFAQASARTSTDPSILEGVTEGPSLYLKNTYDDDGKHAFEAFSSVVFACSSEVIGGTLPNTEQERERWQEVGELLASELKRAANRAGSVSSVPAFLLAHLKRRFKAGSTEKPTKADRQLTKSQAAQLTKEQKLVKMIKEISTLHVGDSGYSEDDLIEDLKYKCERANIEWDEQLVSSLLESSESRGEDKR